MERLTEENQIGPFASLKDKAEAVPGAFGTYECLYAHMVAVTRLKEYEDAMPLERAKWLAQAEKDGRLVVLPSNDPLTLEELRKMDGEPVFIIPTRGSGGFCTWMLVDTKYDLCREVHGEMAVFENCGKTWLAYRRKPEGTA